MYIAYLLYKIKSCNKMIDFYFPYLSYKFHLHCFPLPGKILLVSNSKR